MLKNKSFNIFIYLKTFFVFIFCSVRRQKIAFFRWRFILFFLLFFYILTGLSPVDIFNRVFASFEEELDVIGLYSNLSFNDKNENINNVLGIPEISPTEGKYSFNTDNSLVLSHQNKTLTFENFKPLIDGNNSATADLINIDGAADNNEADSEQTSIEDEDELESGDIGSSSEDLILIEDVSNEADVFIIDQEIGADDLELNGDAGGEDEINKDDVENPIKDNFQDSVVDDVEQASTTTENRDVSFIKNVKNYLTSKFAKAEELLTGKIDKLGDLGEFHGAKIKISLAIFSQIDVQSSTPALTDSENASSTATSVDDVSTSSETLALPEQNSSDNGISNSDIGNENESTDDLINNENSSEGETESVNENATIGDGEESDVNIETDVLPEEDENSNQSADDNVSDEADSDEVSFLIDGFLPKTVMAQNTGVKLIVWSRVKNSSSSLESVWTSIGELSEANFSNKENGGYFTFDAPFLKSWDDIENSEIKIEINTETEPALEVYIDSLWLEIDYQKAEDIEIINKRNRWQNALAFLSESSVLSINEKGEFLFKYTKNKDVVWDNLGGLIGLRNFWKDINLRAKLEDGMGRILDYELDVEFRDDGEFVVRLPDLPQDFRPGKYKLKFYIEDYSGEQVEYLELSQDFSWGVLAINFNKSTYSTGDDAYIQMAVLDDLGHTICDADLFLEIINPDGSVNLLNSSSSTVLIVKNQECGPESIIGLPDYYAYYRLNEPGEYKIKFTAVTESGIREVEDLIYVRNNISYEIERVAPTRIYPKADYPSVVKIKANKFFKGDIVEIVPSGFKIYNEEILILNSTSTDAFGPDYKYYFQELDGIKKLIWHDVELAAGDELEIRYRFDAPNRSPDLFLLGRLSLVSDMSTVSEIRNWQIASDALKQRAKTVMFFAGAYNGASTVGQNTNTNNVFSNFNFKLAEQGVDIKNAYVIFESQIGAYANNTGNYTGYDLAFDSCTESCSADAFYGTNRVLKSDKTVLAYDESESNNIRILFDVTAESQLASYTGGGINMEAGIGYNINFGSIINSIASAKATLVLTYTYDADSPNITNTVSYPLDSTNGTDSGSRQSSIAVCTRNSTCPVFDYNMEIPEFPGISYRLSQWFRMYNANDGNTSVDINQDVNIQTFDVNSANFHYELANNGTQGNMPAMLFPNWASSGFSENSSQQLEYYVDSGTNYSIGGEVFETYVSSSSASVKTRTVSFPLGVINNGGTTALSSDSVNVYFPENGDSGGNVTIKKAWFRIIPNNFNSATLSVTVSSKVGNNSTSGSLVYAYNGATTVVKSSYNLIHIIPSADYAELASANATQSKNVQLNTTFNSTTYDGVSAELVITYTYADEGNGYLTSLSLFAGQTETAGNDQSETMSTANAILPESTGKSIAAAGLLASYFFSASDASVGSAATLDANLSSGAPSCTNAYNADPDLVNNFTEFYKDVTSAMNTTDNQSYSACYTNNGAGEAAGGAKMNGELIYSYNWINTPPTGNFNSVSEVKNGSGVVNIGIEADDADDHDVYAKLEYSTSSLCDFTSSFDPTFNESDASISADFGDPNIDNAGEYQIGTVDASIITASGSNSVFFEWLSGADEAEANGTYCLRLTIFDGFKDQLTSATSTVVLDNLSPTQPGSLSLNSRTGTSITLNYGTTSTDTNFLEYKIFYKPYDGTDPSETDSVYASSSDINLFSQSFNGAATTSIGNLTAHNVYSFSLWAYDSFGNKASSSRVDIEANDAPTSLFNSASQKNDGSGTIDVSIEADDYNNDDNLRSKIEYVSGSSCNFSSPLDPTLSQVNVSADFGLPIVNNEEIFQIGTTSGFIITSPGSNTINFDWLSVADEPFGDGIFCLRLTTNDGLDNQLFLSTSTVVIDNVKPTAPGNLTVGDVAITSIQLIFPVSSPSTDTNEPATDAYKVFYKKGTSGVLETDTEYNSSSFDYYNFNGATSTVIGSLDSNSDYVFNIWAYDVYGNKVSASEVSVKTNATVTNNSLEFTNAATDGFSSNIAVADGAAEWNFRAVVIEQNGWQAISSTTLRLANANDSSSPFDDLEFYWNQTTDTFYEIGNDSNNSVTISNNSSSDCSVNTCTLDFVLVFNKDFDAFSTEYQVELQTSNDSGIIDADTYSDVYQVRRIFLEQIHYRWRNDNGGE